MLTTADRGYGSAWQRARLGYLASHPTCADCARRGRVNLASVVDHIRPHRLGQAISARDANAIAAARRLFWARENWQSLCSSCHSGQKQSLERTGRERGAGPDGIPGDTGHHWRQAAAE